MVHLFLESGATTNSIVSALQNAMTSVSTDVQSAISTVLPIALGIMGFGLVITLGIKYFKKIANKG